MVHYQLQKTLFTHTYLENGHWAEYDDDKNDEK